MKALLLKSLLFLLFSINANADLLPSQITDTTASTTPITTTTTPTLATTTPTSTSASTTASHSSSSETTTTSSASSTSANISATPSLTVISSPVVTSVDGTLLTTVVTVVNPSSSTSSSQPTPSAPPSSDNSSSLSTGSIIGLSVAGGVAVIGLLAFFIWKLTRKRFSDFDDGEAIKWPDLNTHGGGTLDSHPLPVHNTGRAGFDTGSETSLSRINSNNYSTADLQNTPSDPYAVPPLPHLNPNQPYRDDPGAIGGAYYDPYRGPIPGTIEQGTGQEWSGEVIPMTQMNPGGRMSPGPNVAYSGEHVAGRLSPGSQVPYGGRASPSPQAAYGRMSPGPQTAYASPVPPGYDAYGPR